jgi:hypothetical protein
MVKVRTAGISGNANSAANAQPRRKKECITRSL